MPHRGVTGMKKPSPLVSCIMPTGNRPQFVGQAIWYFQRQDYTPRELIIVDDGDSAVADFVPDDQQIRYIRLNRRLSLGEKRNLACKLSQGDYIAHWDDDDWIAPDRLSIQVEQMRLTGTSLCGSRDLLHYDLKTGEAWLYAYSSDTRPWLAGCTLLYRRDAWTGHPFKTRNDGEDTSFVWRFPPNQIRAIPNVDLCVSIVHGRNTAARSLNNPRWQRRPVAEVRRKLGADNAFYAALRNGVSPSPAGKRPVDPHGPAGRSARNSRYRVFSTRSPICSESSRVTVSIPYYQCKPYIRRAVESILAQTYANLLLVVVNDNDPDPPWDVLAHINDPRLVRFDLKQNRGRYFADAVVLKATPDPYFLVQDADDYSEPERLCTLLRKLRADHADGVVSSLYQASVRRGQLARRRPIRYTVARQRLGKELAHRLNHFGLFKVDAMEKVGGFYGGFRISYDTLLMNLLMMTSRIAYVEEPLYTRVVRPGSLTTSEETGLKSAQRHRVREYHKEIYRRSYAAYARYVAGELSSNEFNRYIREQSQQHITAGERMALQRDSDRLRVLLSSKTDL